MDVIFNAMIGFGIILLLFMAVFIVTQQTAAIVERFGRFQSIRQSGLQLRIPLVDRIAGRLSLKITSIKVDLKVHSKDKKNCANFSQ